MRFGYLTKPLYKETTRNPRDMKVRIELLKLCQEIGVYFYPAKGLWPCEHWSRFWELPWAIKRAGVVNGKRILDVGPWCSPLGPYLVRKGAQVTGIDIKPHPLPGVEMIEADLRTWKSRRKFDIVTCISVLEHIEGLGLVNLVERVEKRLVPGGKFLITFDIPLAARCPFGVRPSEFGDLLAWLREERRTKLPRFPFEEGVMCSSDFPVQGPYVGQGIGVCYLEGKRENPA